MSEVGALWELVARARRLTFVIVTRWMFAGVVLFAGCGSAATGEPADTAGQTAATVPSINDAVCSQSVPQDFDFDADPDSMRAEATRLEPMLGQVLAYGSERADEFSGYRLEWIGPSDASVVITMTSDRERHVEALEQVVEFPDELIVCTGPVSGVDAQQLLDDLDPELRNRAASWGKNTAGQVEIGLFADDQAFAQELADRYGNRVKMQLGAFQFPLPDPLPDSRCASLEEGVEQAGLTIEVTSPDRTLARIGDDVRSVTLEAVLTNTGDQLIEFSSGAAIGYLLDADGTVVADSGQMGIGDVGIPVRIEPGESTVLPVIMSTSSCDPGYGYVVPAGDYSLVASVYRAPDQQLLSTPLPVEVK